MTNDWAKTSSQDIIIDKLKYSKNISVERLE